MKKKKEKKNNTVAIDVLSVRKQVLDILAEKLLEDNDLKVAPSLSITFKQNDIVPDINMFFVDERGRVLINDIAQVLGFSFGVSNEIRFLPEVEAVSILGHSLILTENPNGDITPGIGIVSNTIFKNGRDWAESRILKDSWDDKLGQIVQRIENLNSDNTEVEGGIIIKKEGEEVITSDREIKGAQDIPPSIFWKAYNKAAREFKVATLKEKNIFKKLSQDALTSVLNSGLVQNVGFKEYYHGVH